LLKQREKLLRSTVSRLNEDPENLGLQIALTMHKSSVLSLLTEIELVILVKPVEDSYKEQHEKIKKQIKKTLNYGKKT
jgi:tRNA(Ser,Leu) C12 N-acetylase TAN1